MSVLQGGELGSYLAFGLQVQSIWNIWQEFLYSDCDDDCDDDDDDGGGERRGGVK